jgi:hypothetical protein
VSFASTTLCVASQQVIPQVSIYFVVDLVRKLLDTPSYIHTYGVENTLKWTILLTLNITIRT